MCRPPGGSPAAPRRRRVGAAAQRCAPPARRCPSSAAATPPCSRRRTPSSSPAAWGQAAAAWQQQQQQLGGQQRRGFAITPDSGSETHDDFKPKYKAEPASNVDEQIKKDISSNKVFIYMKVCSWVWGCSTRGAAAQRISG